MDDTVNLPNAASARVAEPGWLALDAPAEWAAFSEPYADNEKSLQRSHFVVEGMHCAACSVAVEQALKSVKGVQEAEVSAASGRASVVWSDKAAKPSDMARAVVTAGYRLLPATDNSLIVQRKKARRLALWRWLVAGFCMMQVMMYAWPAYVSGPGEMSADMASLLRWASWVLTLPVMFFSSGPFFSSAISALKQRRIGMDLPVALGIVITFVVSSAVTFDPTGWWGHEVYFDSLTMFVFFLLTGRWLEAGLRDRTAGSLEALMRRLPESTERKNANGIFRRVGVRQLQLGDIIRVLPGEAFPADGRLLRGDTLANESLLTGESRPLAKQMGDTVIAGSYNLSKSVEVLVQQLGKATRYGQIVALMERVATDKPRLAILADRIARPFLILVLIAATGAAAYWWHTDPSRALMAAVAVLIVTCPCALSLATPAAMLATAGALARKGVLVRRLQAIETLAQIDTVVFDKTGTLTHDRMAVADIITRKGLKSEFALGLASALASHSLHPASRALVAAYSGPAKALLDDVQESPGQGITARSGQRQLRLGSAAFCSVEAVSGALQVHLADNDGWLATFNLEEEVREDASEAIGALKREGIAVQMLSGDRQKSAQRIGDRLGLDLLRADATPQDKLAHMQGLQAGGRKVAMVGDGLNDGPVLACANVSVAMGQAVPLAQAQSDFVVLGGQLRVIPELVIHARRTLRVVRQNLAWAALYNAICIPLAVAGILPAWLAGLGMAASSILVVLNAARLTRNGKEA
ncbi:MAG TPA: cation-translocating P-type ATPase [Methylophilaceae bacterium]|nr:cation-translocating P-type ATPase [Methylophilaceae bacterium]